MPHGACCAAGAGLDPLDPLDPLEPREERLLADRALLKLPALPALPALLFLERRPGLARLLEGLAFPWLRGDEELLRRPVGGARGEGRRL